MPGRGPQGEYGEVTSTSNCTDFQARRLNIRYKVPGQKGTHFAHTLNGTAVACTRALVAILENYQNADGPGRSPRCSGPGWARTASPAEAAATRLPLPAPARYDRTGGGAWPPGPAGVR